MTAVNQSRVLRITPLTVERDIAPALARYAALGFERVESGEPGCVGMQADNGAIILASVDYLQSTFVDADVEALAGTTMPYIHVESVSDARHYLPASCILLQDVRTRGGTRELLVRDGADYLVLAEKVGPPTCSC